VLQVAQQGYGHQFSLRGEKDSDARDACFRGLFTGGEKGSERHCLARQARFHQSAPRQVVMTVKTTRPITNGNQPPVGIFSAFAPNCARSTVMIGATTTATVGHCQRQTPRMTAPARTVVMVIVPVTAKP